MELTFEELKKELEKHLLNRDDEEMVVEINEDSSSQWAKGEKVISVYFEDHFKDADDEEDFIKTKEFTLQLTEDVITLIDHPYRFATQWNKDLITHIVGLTGTKIVFPN